MLPSAAKDEKHISFRELPTTSARAVRLFMHAAMYCGVVAHAKGQKFRVFDNIVNKDSMCTMHQEDEAEYVAAHFSNDWKHLVDNLSSNCEDLAAALHALLRKMSVEVRDLPKGNSAKSDYSSLSWEKLGLQARSNWEETMETKYLSSTVKSYETDLQELHMRWGGADEDGKFVAELKEGADVRYFPKQKREAELPQLWAYRTPVTLDALHSRLGVHQGSAETMPVLCTVLQQPLFPVLRALGMLAGVFEWHSLVMNHFSGRITRANARSMKVGEFLGGLPPTDRGRWDRAYAEFEGAWRIAWPYVERFECMELTENLKKVQLTRDSEMIWCIADSSNEGICPLALTQWLVERHNELVQVVSAARGYPGRKVSSRLLGQHDVVCYDGEELMRFLRTRCVTYGVGGNLNFDFQQLEQHLRQELVRPEITIELRAFQWLGETFAAMSELKTVIRQRDLSPEVVDRLKSELTSPSVANLCLQKVQMSISFILKSAGALKEHAGEMLLSDYFRSVLSESSEALPSATARVEVHLWHVDAFARILRQTINKDPMDAIDPKYKVDLPEELERELLAAKRQLPEQLADILGSFGESRLGETWIAAESPMIDTLKEVISEDVDGHDLAQLVQDLLPSGLQMQHWGATYQLLRRA